MELNGGHQRVFNVFLFVNKNSGGDIKGVQQGLNASVLCTKYTWS